jgi:4-hydroxybenzoate polyprenyltransferase
MPNPVEALSTESGSISESDIALGGLAGVTDGAMGAGREIGRSLVSLVRPGQWPKNVLAVSVPLLNLEAWHAATFWRLAWAICAFTIASTIIYVTNDIADRNRDRAHPAKRRRPIACGRVPVPMALGLAAALLLLLVAVLDLEPWGLSWPIGAYLVLATWYSVALKHIAPLDIFVVALGFGLRLMEGYLATGTPISGWLLTGAFCGCLLFIIGKRRQELTATTGGHRPALRGYTVELTGQLMVFSAVLAAGSYLLYVRTEAPLGRYALAATVLTAPLVLFGLFRYLQLVLVHEGGGDPVRMLLRDPALVANSLLWAAVCGGFTLAYHLGPPQ